MMNSKTAAVKANRLVRNHRVILVVYGQALAIGGHDTHDVNKIDHHRTCNRGRYIRHWSECSRVQAVHKVLKEPDSQVPVSRIAGLLNNATYLASRKESA